MENAFHWINCYKEDKGWQNKQQVTQAAFYLQGGFQNCVVNWHVIVHGQHWRSVDFFEVRIITDLGVDLKKTFAYLWYAMYTEHRMHPGM